MRDATTNTRTIWNWWLQWLDANVGVAAGAASGLLVLDVDPRNGGVRTLDNTQARFGELPTGPIARTGGGGQHRFFGYPGEQVRGTLGPGLDVQGDGKLIVAPSSIHRSGRIYEWETDPDRPIPTLPQPWLGALVTPRWHTRECGGIWGEDGALDERIRKAIERTLPTAWGQRHRSIFEFARTLKADPELAKLSPDALKPYVEQWHALALPEIRTKPFDETWFDFADGWKRVKHPKGGFMVAIAKRAMVAEVPAVASQYEQEKLRRLVTLCRELQHTVGDHPFCLSARMAGDIVEVSCRQAARWLNGLVLDGILALVSKGDHVTRKASEYRYLGD